MYIVAWLITSGTMCYSGSSHRFSYSKSDYSSRHHFKNVPASFLTPKTADLTVSDSTGDEVG